MSTIVPLALLLLTAGDPVPAPEAGAEADSVVRVYDLRAVTPVFDSGDGWEQSLFMAPSGRYSDVEIVLLSELHERASADIIVDLIGQVFGDELRYEGHEISLSGDSKLMVLAPEALHARVAELLGLLERVLSTEVELAIDVIELPGGAPVPEAGLVEQAEAERMIATFQRQGAVHASYEARLFPGQTTGVDLTRLTSFLADHDVEIAQGATVFDPVVDLAQEGRRLLLRGVPGADGLYLSVVFQEARLLGEMELETVHAGGTVWYEGGQYDVDEQLQVQKVKSFQRCFAFDTFLPFGKAAVAYSEIDSMAGSLPVASRQVLILRRRSSGASSFHDIEVPGTTRRLLAVNTELFNPPQLTVTGPWGDLDEAVGQDVLIGARLSSEPSLFFFDWFKRRFTVWRRLGPWALAITDPAWDDQGARELRELVASWSPDTDVSRVDVRLHRSADPRTPVRWSVPLRAGAGCAARIGIASLALTDYDVEVAQMAGVSDPLLTMNFDGLAVGMTASRGGAGGLHLDLRALAQLAGGAMPRLETTSRISNVFDLPAFDRLVLEERLSFVRNASTPFRVRLGDSGQPGPAGLQLEINLK